MVWHSDHPATLAPVPQLRMPSDLLGQLSSPLPPSRLQSLPHPFVPPGTTWFTKHPLHPLLGTSSNSSRSVPVDAGAPPPHSRLALCLFGVPGVHRGKAGQLHTSAAALVATATTHLKFLLQAAESQGSQVSVFSHSWNVSAIGDVPTALALIYGARLHSLLHQPLEVKEHVNSMLRSMTRSLTLARDAAAAQRETHDLILLMRHDTYWTQPLDLRLDPRFLTVATWLSDDSPGSSLCTRLSSLDGVPDLWFASSPTMLEFVFGSLNLRRHNRQQVHANNRAHFVFQSHFDDLNLTSRQLIRAHPKALYPNGSSCLYRMRESACRHPTQPGHRQGDHEGCWQLSWHRSCEETNFCDVLTRRAALRQAE